MSPKSKHSKAKLIHTYKPEVRFAIQLTKNEKDEVLSASRVVVVKPEGRREITLTLKVPNREEILENDTELVDYNNILLSLAIKGVKEHKSQKVRSRIINLQHYLLSCLTPDELDAKIFLLQIYNTMDRSNALNEITTIINGYYDTNIPNCFNYSCLFKDISGIMIF